MESQLKNKNQIEFNSRTQFSEKLLQFPLKYVAVSMMSLEKKKSKEI